MAVSREFPAGGQELMNQNLFLAGLSLCFVTPLIQAQASHAPYAPFTAQQAESGRQLSAKSQEIRRDITDLAAPAEPFKIMGNLYFVGSANGEVFLLTSPQGHILLGAGAANSTEAVEKNIESLGFKMTDIKAILVESQPRRSVRGSGLSEREDRRGANGRIR